MIDLSTYTDPDLDALRVQVLTEQERRRLLADAPAQQKTMAAQYAAAVAAYSVGMDAPSRKEKAV